MNESTLIYAMASGWPEIAAGLKPNHCIIAARVAVEVGRYFGVPITPRAVDAIAFNGKGYELFQRGVPATEWPSEAWSVAAVRDDRDGYERSPHSGYDGHVIVESPRYIVDLSAEQFHRPGRTLDVGSPIVIEKPETYDPTTVIARHGETTVIYIAEDGQRFATAPDWRNRLNYGVEAAAMIKFLQGVDLSGTVPYPVGSEVSR